MDTATQSPEFNQERLQFFVNQLYKTSIPFASPGLSGLIKIALGKLPPHEQETVISRYGLFDGRFKSIEEISVLADPPLTPLAISLRLTHAIRRLRCRGWSANIRTYLLCLSNKGIS